MGRKDIQLIQLTPTEVQAILSGVALAECRGYACAASDLVPDVVAKYAMDGYRSGNDWFWCAPRLLCDVFQRMIVGSGCFKRMAVENTIEIGYGVAEAHAGKGYASSGVARMVEEAFAHGFAWGGPAMSHSGRDVTPSGVCAAN